MHVGNKTNNSVIFHSAIFVFAEDDGDDDDDGDDNTVVGFYI
jgi:hypothetical protein